MVMYSILFAVVTTILTKVMILNADIPLEKKMKIDGFHKKAVFFGAIVLGFIVF